MTSMDFKISFLWGYALTMAASITFVGVLSAAILGLIGGFFGLLGKELFYYTKNKIKSAAFKVKMIGYWDKFRKWF